MSAFASISEPEALHALLVWPGGSPPATLQALLEDAGLTFDIAASPEAAIPIARQHDHQVVLAPPPEPGGLWLAPLLAAVPSLETIALVDPRDPLAESARRAGADELADPRRLPAADLTHLVSRAAQRSRLRRDNRRLLEENMEGLRAQAIYQRCLDLLATVEIEVLQELVLKVFSELVEAKSAALWIRTQRGLLSLRAHLGLVSRASLPSQIDLQGGPLAARIEAREPFTAAPTYGGVLGHNGFYVPIVAGGQTLGLLLLEDKLGGSFDARDLAQARTVADFAGIALRNAKRFHELERVGLRDRESPTYNLSYFIDYAGKELYKASRYGRQFSLCTLHIDNLEQLRARVSPATFTEAVRSFISTLAGLARDSDVLARVAENELYLILPETDRFGVMMVERRLQDAIREHDERVAEAAATGPDGLQSFTPQIGLTVGSATYPLDGRDFDELLLRCRQRSAEARHTLRRRLQLGDLDFWQSLSALLGPWPARVEAQSVASPAPGEPPIASASYRGPLPDNHFERVQKEVGRELAREPRARGLLYVSAGGAGDVEPSFPLLDIVPPDVVARVCVLVRRGLRRIDHAAVSTVFLQGASPLTPSALQLEFMLYLSESSAYAYARRRREPIAFHSSDRPLVDHLISRLQQAYDLQPY